jgi:hypothetical protein
MAQRKETKKNIKVRDLKPKKDAKGGFAMTVSTKNAGHGVTRPGNPNTWNTGKNKVASWFNPAVRLLSFIQSFFICHSTCWSKIDRRHARAGMRGSCSLQTIVKNWDASKPTNKNKNGTEKRNQNENQNSGLETEKRRQRRFYGFRSNP